MSAPSVPAAVVSGHGQLIGGQTEVNIEERVTG